MRTRLRLVLDTNVWLDWLVFADVSVNPIKEAVARGHAGIFISPACETELARVLGYPLSGRALDAEAQAAALARCRTITCVVSDAARVHAAAGAHAAAEVHAVAEAHDIAELPRCADPDDQMFLELARDCRADALITKDRDLLALATRKVKPLPFRIITPREYANEFAREGEHEHSRASGIG